MLDVPIVTSRTPRVLCVDIAFDPRLLPELEFTDEVFFDLACRLTREAIQRGKQWPDFPLGVMERALRTYIAAEGRYRAHHRTVEIKGTKVAVEIFAEYHPTGIDPLVVSVDGGTETLLTRQEVPRRLFGYTFDQEAPYRAERDGDVVKFYNKRMNRTPVVLDASAIPGLYRR